jgi:hypothetical protein
MSLEDQFAFDPCFCKSIATQRLAAKSASIQTKTTAIHPLFGQRSPLFTPFLDQFEGVIRRFAAHGLAQLSPITHLGRGRIESDRAYTHIRRIVVAVSFENALPGKTRAGRSSSVRGRSVPSALSPNPCPKSRSCSVLKPSQLPENLAAFPVIARRHYPLTRRCATVQVGASIRPAAAPHRSLSRHTGWLP